MPGGKKPPDRGARGEGEAGAAEISQNDHDWSKIGGRVGEGL